MVLMGMRSGTRRLLGGVWNSAFRVKSPRYPAVGEQVGDSAPYQGVWELVSCSAPGGVVVGGLVVAGQVAAYTAGPAALLSALIAALSVGLTGICYGELRARWPRVNGTPYEYVYLSIGEGVAFVVGWLCLLQDMAMVAAASRASSHNLDLLLNQRLHNLTLEYIGCVDTLNSCPDFVGGVLVVVVGVIVALGLRGRQKLVTFVTSCLVLLVVVFSLIVGLFHLNFELWRNPVNFFPTSYPGVIEGAAMAVYAISSFEIICSKSDFSRQTAGRTTVTAFTLSLLLSLGVFMAIASTTTLLAPISHLHTETPLPEAFSQAGVVWIKFILCIATILGLLVYMWLTLSRIHDLLEAISLDALLCSNFSDVGERTGTALISVSLPCVFASTFSVLFSLTNLLQLASLSCLMVSTITCTAAVCIRFRPSILVHSPEHTTHRDRQERRKQRKKKQGLVEGEPVRNGGYGSVSTNNNTDDCPMLVIDSEDEEEHFIGISNDEQFLHARIEHLRRHNDDSSDTDIDDAVEEYKEQLRIAALTSCSFTTPNSENPTDKTARRAAWTVVLFVISLFFLFMILTWGVRSVRAGNAFLIVVLIAFLLLIIALLFVLLQQPQDPVSSLDLKLSFPLSPWVPLLAIVINVHFALHLAGLAWIQATVISVIGSLVYFIYGMKNSRASHFYEFLPEEETILLPEPPCHLVESRVVSRQALWPTNQAVLQGDTDDILMD